MINLFMIIIFLYLPDFLQGFDVSQLSPAVLSFLQCVETPGGFVNLSI